MILDFLFFFQKPYFCQIDLSSKTLINLSAWSSEDESFTASDEPEDTNENAVMDVEELTEVTSDIEEDNTPKE